MRMAICIAILSACIQTAMAQDTKSPTPDANQKAEASKSLTTQLIQKELEAAGLMDVHVSPQVHVVQAKDKDGKQIVLVVDPETMLVIPLGLSREPSTTGSGSEDEGDEKEF
jgi:uncharacterized protein YpmB